MCNTAQPQRPPVLTVLVPGAPTRYRGEAPAAIPLLEPLSTARPGVEPRLLVPQLVSGGGAGGGNGGEGGSGVLYMDGGSPPLARHDVCSYSYLHLD